MGGTEVKRRIADLKATAKKDTGIKVSTEWALNRLYLMGIIPMPPSCTCSTGSRNSRGPAVVGEICPTGGMQTVV